MFQPIDIGPMTVANRIYMPPHGIPLTVPGFAGLSVPSDDFAAYYAERARAGVGLFGHSLAMAPLLGGLACPALEESVGAFAAVADAVHEHGARIFGQLHYSSLTAGPWEPLSPRAPVFGVVATQRFERYDTCHALTRDEIELLVGLYRRCSRNLLRAGYDGVQIHASHGVLMEQFLSPYFNHRDDEYGGDAKGRMRLLVEALTAIRDECGDGLATGVRLICDERLTGGLTAADVEEIALDLVDRALVDFIDLDIAVEPQQPELMTTPSLVAPLHMVNAVAALRKTVPAHVPMLSSVGRVTSVAEAEKVLAAGAVDLVGIGRGLIAEPELVRNAKEGREQRSRACIACNHCIATVQRPGGGYGCALNPATGRERRWGTRTFVPAPIPGTVVVVGGGPAGLEAARVAALRGHQVTLLEREPELGGQLARWARLPGRHNYGGVVDWYLRELDSLNVTVRTDTAASLDAIAALASDAVIVATGSRYVSDGQSAFAPSPIPGWDRDFVLRPEQVLDPAWEPRPGSVLILDEEGINTAAGIAELLARAGMRVHLVTRHPDLVHNLTFDGHAPIITRTLRRYGVRVSPHSYLRRIGDHTVTLYDVRTGMERLAAGVDFVVLATMRTPSDDLSAKLGGTVGRVFVIGDALAPRGLAEATYEGQRFARLLGEPDAPRSTFESLLNPIPPVAFPRAADASR
ncbi:FAD-dependent oxidoreductase [Nocardia sp. NPDC050175]|uniref:FAD-dependent oxidoreductase n=1 Tax=Nocardia sp. NPDC050175 TaxID=3364317 RepID=UPI00378FD66A